MSFIRGGKNGKLKEDFLPMKRNLSALFSPKSVAVVGASRKPGKVGAIILENIKNSGFKGQIYPVNPGTTDINGLKCYPDLAGLPEVPDLVMIAVPPEAAIQTVEAAGQKGVKNAVVITADFKEAGPEGAQREEKLKEAAEKYGINLLGPNCLGFVNNNCPINATFGEVYSRPGNLRFVSQSGAIATSLFDWCKSAELGYSDFITLGNKADLSENDALAYLRDIPKTALSSKDAVGLSGVSPIGLYLESISQGQDFVKLAAEISRTDPIFILKPGRTPAAAKAMQSHTGAIAGAEAVLEVALSKAGIIRCNELEDFFDLSRAFSWEDAPAGPKVAIISNAGGPAVISADAVIKEGLELAQFTPEVKKQLLGALPRSASIGDPVDVLGDALADRYRAAAEIILRTDEADALIVILTPQVMTQIEQTARIVGQLSEKYRRPIFCSFIGGSLVIDGEKVLNRLKIPSFRFPERAIAAVGAMWRWKKWQQDQKPAAETFSPQWDTDRLKDILAKAQKEKRPALDSLEANEMLLTAGITVPPGDKVDGVDQAREFARTRGYPVVLKLSSPGILHRTDVGGVVTGIEKDADLLGAWDKLEQKIAQLDEKIRPGVRIQIQKEVGFGVEVIAGVKRDPTFGPVILFGAGGKLAELLADRNLALLPLDMSGAKELIARSKIFPLLCGYRGEPPYALDKLYDLLVRLGKLAETLPEISEMEVNPAIVTLNEAWAVDGKVVLENTPVSAGLPAGPKFKSAQILSHQNPAGKYHEFVFATDEPFTFKPGQYVSVRVAEDRINAYSVFSSSQANNFNLMVDTSPGGVGSKFFEALKPGDRISFLGPFGVFTFKPDDGAKELLFLGTGSGCSPLRSIIEDLLLKQNEKREIYFYFGLRYPGDIFWRDYFDNLSQKYSNFHFVLTLSKPDETWKGNTGHITDLVAKDFPDMRDVSAYLCGNKEMIEQSGQILTAGGCPKERIYHEKFF